MVSTCGEDIAQTDHLGVVICFVQEHKADGSTTSRLTGLWRCEVPITPAPPSARWASCSGRTREGPEPKRPSTGLIWIVASREIWFSR